MDTGIGKRHMVIKYNLDNREYYLRDLGDGSGTFVRLDVPLVRKIKNLNYSIIGVETRLYNIVRRLSHGCAILPGSTKR